MISVLAGIFVETSGGFYPAFADTLRLPRQARDGERRPSTRFALGRVLKKPACGEPVESVEGRSRTIARGCPPEARSRQLRWLK
jgi:hypothetical protein